MIAFVVFPA